MALNNVRSESNQSGHFLFNPVKSAHEENRAIAGAVAEARILAAGQSGEYIGPIELLFIPS